MPDPIIPPGGAQPQQPPQILVDTDWKAQAQAEKERLVASEKAKAASKPGIVTPGGSPAAPSPARPAAAQGPAPRAAAPTPEAGPGGPEAMPPGDFRTLVGSLATQALLYMGGIADPETGRAVVALDYAHHYLDLLGVLEQKTKGNLTPEENEELTEILYELRMRFVRLTEAVARAEERAVREAAAKAPDLRAGPMGTT